MQWDGADIVGADTCCPHEVWLHQLPATWQSTQLRQKAFSHLLKRLPLGHISLHMNLLCDTPTPCLPHKPEHHTAHTRSRSRGCSWRAACLAWPQLWSWL